MRSEKQKYRQELIPNGRFKQCCVFVRNDLVERKIRSRRVASKQFLEFEEKLGLDRNEYSFDEQDIINALQVAFEGEIVHTQYCVENKRLDFYFFEGKLGIEIDEYGHVDRNSEYEQSRKLMIGKNLGCKIIRTDPDAPDLNIWRLINQVCMHIKHSTRKSTKKLLVDDLSKELWEAVIELKSKYKDIKAKLIKNVLNDVLPEYKKWLVKK